MSVTAFNGPLAETRRLQDRLSAIQAAAEPVREWMEFGAYGFCTEPRFETARANITTLLDTINQPDKPSVLPATAGPDEHASQLASKDCPEYIRATEPEPSGRADGTQNSEIPLYYQHYYSTYCIHSDHEHCRKTCKTCKAPCLCECHKEPADV